MDDTGRFLISILETTKNNYIAFCFRQYLGKEVVQIQHLREEHNRRKCGKMIAKTEQK